MWKMSFPPEVVVSMASVIDSKPILLAAVKGVMVSIRCLGERPSRSSLQTTRMSPSRAVGDGLGKAEALSAGAGCGVGEERYSPPTSASASCCEPGLVAVKTRA